MTSQSELGEEQLVVSLLHQSLVKDRLRVHGITPVDPDESPELGLVRWSLRREQLAGAVADLPSQEGDTPLASLLGALYREFEVKYGGWTPIMGRNRPLLPVRPANVIGIWDEGAPASAGPAVPGRRLPGGEAGRGATVLVADTGVIAHPELLGRFVAHPDALLPVDSPDPRDPALGHATFVSGLVLREAPGATLEVRRVIGPDGTRDSWDVAKELVRLSGSDADVVNLSLGCFTDDGKAPLVLATALRRLDPDIVVVAAAGNVAERRPSAPVWPAALDEVVAVGSTKADGGVSSWSPDPKHNPWVDVLACGDAVSSTFLYGPVQVNGKAVDLEGYARWSGTSFAAARVSGMIAARVRPGHCSAREALESLRGHHQGAPPRLG